MYSGVLSDSYKRVGAFSKPDCSQTFFTELFFRDSFRTQVYHRKISLTHKYTFNTHLIPMHNTYYYMFTFATKNTM